MKIDHRRILVNIVILCYNLLFLFNEEEVAVDSEEEDLEAGLALQGHHQDQVLDLLSDHHHQQEDHGHQAQVQKNITIMNLNTALPTGKGNPTLQLIIGEETNKDFMGKSQNI